LKNGQGGDVVRPAWVVGHKGGKWWVMRMDRTEKRRRWPMERMKLRER
jgi:hypothetical protein